VESIRARTLGEISTLHPENLPVSQRFPFTALQY
jgi:hypothetical protein